MDGLHSEQTAALLANDNIAVRAGLHCAPSAHKTYGTLREGTVRIAPSIFTKKAGCEFIVNFRSKKLQKTVDCDTIYRDYL